MSTTERPKIRGRRRSAVFHKCGGRCAYCGCVLSKGTFTIDHLVPYAKFVEASLDAKELSDLDPDDLSNLMPACQDCNSYKGDLSLEEFRSKLSEDFGGEVTFYFEAQKKDPG